MSIEHTAPGGADYERVLQTLRLHHIGQARGIHVADLARTLALEPRTIRFVVSAAREVGEPICATPKHGYYLAQTPDELQETVDFLISRALCSLHYASRLSKRPLLQLMGQMQLELERLETLKRDLDDLAPPTSANNTPTNPTH